MKVIYVNGKRFTRWDVKPPLSMGRQTFTVRLMDDDYPRTRLVHTTVIIRTTPDPFTVGFRHVTKDGNRTWRVSEE